MFSLSGIPISGVVRSWPLRAPTVVSKTTGQPEMKLDGENFPRVNLKIGRSIFAKNREKNVVRMGCDTWRWRNLRQQGWAIVFCDIPRPCNSRSIRVQPPPGSLLHKAMPALKCACLAGEAGSNRRPIWDRESPVIENNQGQSVP